MFYVTFMFYIRVVIFTNSIFTCTFSRVIHNHPLIKGFTNNIVTVTKDNRKSENINMKLIINSRRTN